jgi:hypothetical protein
MAIGTGGNSTGAGGKSTGAGGKHAGGVGGGAACPPGQQVLQDGVCACPSYKPDYCAAAGKCVNLVKDPDFCGSCEQACGATQACVDSDCTPELGTVAEVAGCGKLLLVQAHGTLYALNTLAGELLSVPVAGGAPASITMGLSDARAFAVNATTAYVAVGNKVAQIDLSSGARVDVVTEPTPIYDVALDASSVYYATDKPASDSSEAHLGFAGFIKRAPLAGGAGVVVAGGMDQGQPHAVVVSGSNILYASESAKNVEVQKGLPVAADAYTDPLHYKLGASQGSLMLGHRAVQTDGTYLYWTNEAVQRSKFGDPAPVQEQATGSLGLTTAFALSPTTVYFGSDQGDLGRGAIRSDEATPMARRLDNITSMVVDATHVYVASGCKILKAPL